MEIRGDIPDDHSRTNIIPNYMNSTKEDPGNSRIIHLNPWENGIQLLGQKLSIGWDPSGWGAALLERDTGLLVDNNLSMI